MATSPTKRDSARDRLLAAADELFYSEGIHTVGIDRVIERAGVAKGSLYYIFGSKDELVRSYLTGRHGRWVARINEGLEAYDAPRDRVLGVFDLLGQLFAEPDYNGCAFMNASAEAKPGSAEEQVVDQFRGWLRLLFRDLVDAIGVADAGTLTEQLVMLYDGANVASQMDRNLGAASSARVIAAALIDAAMARAD
jgi:AcrR family transcriptional regulator